MRMDNPQLPNTALHWQSSGSRRRDSPRNTMDPTYQTSAKPKHVNPPQWEDMLAVRSLREDLQPSLMPCLPLKAEVDLRSMVSDHSYLNAPIFVKNFILCLY